MPTHSKAGSIHGVLIASNTALFIIWTAENETIELNTYAIYENGKNISFSVDHATGKVTVTAENATALTYIGN